MPDASLNPAVATTGPVSGPGAVRAAAVLLGLGPELAAQVFRQLGDADLRRVALGAKNLRQQGQGAVAQALHTFVDSLRLVGGDMAAGDEMLREVALKALGPEAARRAFDGINPPPLPDEVLGSVATADPEALAMVLSREQPQTVALVLSAIDFERSALVLDKLPEALRPEVLKRMATIESVAPEVLREVGQALAIELKAVVAGGMRRVDGRKAALELLRRTPTAQQREVVSEIEKEDASLAAELRTRLFTFEDLVHLSDRDVQGLIKEIDLSRLGLALKGATPNVRERFLRNMSTRAAQMLSDDLSAMGAVRLATVEEAQAEIAKVAVGLADQGRLTIVHPSDKMV